MDETYIKMCREAKEIQDRWDQDNPKIGELYFDPLHEKIFPVSYDHEDLSYIKHLAGVGLIWIPRQEDLQDIYLNDFYAGMHVSTMVNSFHRWFWAEYNDKIKGCLEQYNWNEIWLCFVMQTCYNKRWSGESWENIR